MTKTRLLARRRPRLPVADPAELLAGFQDGHRVVRAELHDGMLTIKAERSEKKKSKGRSEFSCGSFVRSVTLPAGVDEHDIRATYYDKDILTISVAVPKRLRQPRNISPCRPPANQRGGPGAASTGVPGPPLALSATHIADRAPGTSG